VTDIGDVRVGVYQENYVVYKLTDEFTLDYSVTDFDDYDQARRFFEERIMRGIDSSV